MTTKRVAVDELGDKKTEFIKQVEKACMSFSGSITKDNQKAAIVLAMDDKQEDDGTPMICAVYGKEGGVVKMLEELFTRPDLKKYVHVAQMSVLADNLDRL